MLDKNLLFSLVLLMTYIVYCQSTNEPIINYKLTLLSPIIDDYNIESNAVLSKINFEIPTINICLGTHRQCFPFSISLNLPYLYVLGYDENSNALRFFDQSKSSTFESFDHSFLIIHQSIGSDSMNSTDFLRGNEEFNSQIKPSKFNFFSIVNENKNYKYDTIAGVIGLAKNAPRKNTNESLTFMTYLNYLYSNGFIKHNIVVFSYNDVNGGQLTFGEAFTNRMLPYCSSNRSGHYRWICKFHKMKIGYSKFINKFIFIFDPSYPLITGPYYTIANLFKLNVNISKKKCIIEKEKDVGVLVCDDNVDLNEFPDFVLFYHDSELRLKMKNVFKEVKVNGKKKKVCLIVGVDDSNNFIMGLPAFNNNVLIFDHDQLKIFFPNGKYDLEDSNDNDSFGHVNKGDSIILKISSGLIIGLLLCGIGIQIYNVKKVTGTFT